MDKTENGTLPAAAAPEERSYAAGEILAARDENAPYGGIITHGTAFLESTDSEGMRRIIDIYESGDVFITKSFPEAVSESMVLTAKTACGAVIFSDREATEKHDIGAENAGVGGGFASEHSGAAEAQAMTRLLAHIRILGEHSLRQKIMAFLEYESARQKSAVVRIGMSFADVADYIGADRSAMMRELKNMCGDGIIRRSGRTIELI